jgi:hypothetical protein
VLDASKPADEPKKEAPKYVPPKPISNGPVDRPVPPKRVRGDTLPPPYVETSPEWTITVHAEDNTDWNELLLSATKLKLTFAKSEDDVKEMFKVNRNLYDSAKVDAPAIYDQLMDMFKETKLKFKDQ